MSTGETPPRKVAAKLTQLDRDTIDLVKASNGVVNVDINDRPIAEWNAGSISYRVKRLVALGVLERQETVYVEGCPPIVHYQIVKTPDAMV